MKKYNICAWLLIMATPFFNTIHAQCRQLVWADEFDGNTLNNANWSYDIGGSGWGNNELQYYTDRTENTQVSGGTLKIIAKAEAFGGKNYTSARLLSRYKADFRYGRLEARLKTPRTQGIWPAFWMLPTSEAYGGWPYSGEIDIMELLGHEPNKSYATLHAEGTAPGLSIYSSSNYVLSTGTFADAFHTFAIEWSPVEIKFYIDNILIATKSATSLAASPRPFPFDQPFFFLLNVAVGGNWPGNPNASTVLPQTMEVDYVRVYQSIPEASITGATRVTQLVDNNYAFPNTSDATYSWSADAFGTITAGQSAATVTAHVSQAGSTLTLSANSPTCGTATQSIFVATSNNLIYNPSFETGLANWSPRPNNYATIATTATGVFQGSKAVSVTVPIAAPNPWDVQLSYPNLALTAAQPYTLKFWAKADQNGRTVSAAVINSTTYAQYANQTFSLGTTWQEYTINFTQPVTANALFNFDCGRGGTFYFDYILLAPTETVLPIELLAFSAKSREDGIEINWKFVADKSLKKIRLQYSDDGINFRPFYQHFYPTTQPERYQYTPPPVYSGKQNPLTHYFRIAIVDAAEKETYSKIISVLATDVHNWAVYPNPIIDTINIKSPEEEMLSLYVFDAMGKKVMEKDMSTPVAATAWSLSDLPSGQYFLHVKTLRNGIKIIPFIKQ